MWEEITYQFSNLNGAAEISIQKSQVICCIQSFSVTSYTTEDDSLVSTIRSKFYANSLQRNFSFW